MPPTIILEFELIAKLVLVIKNCWKDVIPQTPTHPQQSCQKFIKTFVKWQQCDSLFFNAILLRDVLPATVWMYYRTIHYLMREFPVKLQEKNWYCKEPQYWLFKWTLTWNSQVQLWIFLKSHRLLLKWKKTPSHSSLCECCNIYLMLAQERPFQLKQLSRLSGTSIITVLVKAIAELHACKVYAHYTKCPCSVYKVSTHLTRTLQANTQKCV